MSDGQGRPGQGARGAAPLITDARTPASVEHDSRVKRYVWTMAFRMACFVAMFFVDSPLRWVLFAGAVLLPYVAVIVANQANQRQQRVRIAGVPLDRPQLTAGPEDPEVIVGAVTRGRESAPASDEKDRDRKVA